jgi:hypothetical protein
VLLHPYWAQKLARSIFPKQGESHQRFSLFCVSSEKFVSALIHSPWFFVGTLSKKQTGPEAWSQFYANKSVYNMTHSQRAPRIVLNVGAL